MDKNERYKWRLKRMGKDITQQELADYLGYTKSMISKYEKSQTNMPEDKIKLYESYIENKEIEWEE